MTFSHVSVLDNKRKIKEIRNRKYSITDIYNTYITNVYNNVIVNLLLFRQI